MKRLLLLTGALVTAAAAYAASLPAEATPGAVFAFYTRNLAIKKAFFVDFQAELARQKLTWNDLIALFGGEEADKAASAELKRVLPLFSLDAIGQEGLFAIYPDGSLLALARPSAASQDRVLGALKQALGPTRPYHGWQVKDLSQPEENYQVLAGYRGRTMLLYGHLGKQPGIAGGFFAAQVRKGLRFPLEGDLAYFFDARPLVPLAEQLAKTNGQGEKGGFPPRLLAALKTPESYAAALTLDTSGIRSRARFVLNPGGDPELAGLFLAPCRPWALGDLPRGVSASSFCFPIAKFGSYLGKLARDFGQEGFDLDLTAFGDRVAFVSFAPEKASAPPTGQNLAGDLLVFIEARDDLTAETTLLSWLQLLAASSTPSGQGGFSVERFAVGSYQGKKITLGLGQPVYLFNLGDRIALATSEQAARALAGPKLSSDPLFQKYADRYPADAHSLGFGDLRRSVKSLARELLTTTPLAVSQTTTPKEAMALLERVANYLDFVAGKLGAVVSYTRIEDHAVVSESFSEVHW